MKLAKVGDIIYFAVEDEFYNKSYGIVKQDVGIVVRIYGELFAEVFMQRLNKKIDILLDHVEVLGDK